MEDARDFTVFLRSWVSSLFSSHKTLPCLRYSGADERMTVTVDELRRKRRSTSNEKNPFRFATGPSDCPRIDRGCISELSDGARRWWDCLCRAGTHIRRPSC